MDLTGQVIGKVAGQAYGSVLRPPRAGGLVRKFFAITPNLAGIMTLQLRGQGTPTSTHVSDIYAEDHEGIYCLFGQDEPVWEGGRVVRNLLSYSEDFSQTVWLKGNTSYVTETNIVNFPIEGSYIRQLGISGSQSYPQGSTCTGSIELSGSGTCRLRLLRFAGTYEYSQRDVELTSTPKRYTLAHTIINTDIVGFSLRLERAAGQTATQVTANYAQFEDSTGHTDTTTPSEYIKTITAPVQKVFVHENGNTVDGNGVVTEAKGDLLDPQPYLLYMPALTNDQIYSNDQTNVEWTATNVTPVQDETGIGGSANYACTLTATAGNGTVIANAVTAASDTHATAWHIKRKTGTGTIELTVDGGTTWQDITSSIDSSFARIAVDQEAVTNPQIGIRIVTSGDAVIVGNAESHLNKSLAEVRSASPIFTTTAAQSTNRTDYTFDIANHNDAQGAYYLEAVIERGDIEANVVGGGIISVAASQSSLYYFGGASKGCYSYDGTKLTSVDSVLDFNEHRCSLVYDTKNSLKVIKFDLLSSAEEAYNGSYSSSFPLALFLNSIYPQRIRNLQRWQGGTYQQLKDKIDELMV